MNRTPNISNGKRTVVSFMMGSIIATLMAACTTGSQYSNHQRDDFSSHEERVRLRNEYDKKQQTPVLASTCKGQINAPKGLKPTFDAPLVDESLGQPGKGGLCEAASFNVTTDDIWVYRLWNSTNPNSRLGNWWSARMPVGAVSKYRKNYAICYQWTPLDKMTKCKLKKGATIVVGTGQSAECSDFLTYPASATNQLFLSGSNTPIEEQVESCTDVNVTFGWE